MIIIIINFVLIMQGKSGHIPRWGKTVTFKKANQMWNKKSDTEYIIISIIRKNTFFFKKNRRAKHVRCL